MARRMHLNTVLQSLGSIELLARQAVTAASQSSSNPCMRQLMSRATLSTPSLSARLFKGSCTSSPHLSSTAVIPVSLQGLHAPYKTVCHTYDDATHLGRQLFKQDTRPASAARIPRRIARLNSRRPLLRQLDSLHWSLSATSSTLRLTRPFFTSSARAYSTNANPDSSTSETGNTKSSGLMGKLKDLTRKYGWATVVVYFIISAVDFGLCFFLINLVGAEHVRKGQDYVLDALVYGTTKREDVLAQAGEPKGYGLLGFLKNWRQKHKLEDVENEVDSKRAGTSSLWATAVLAYGIHKTLLLPVRLGLTAAATPAIVKYLQRFGLNIARTPIPDSVKKRSAQSIKSGKERFDKAREKHKNWL